MVEEFTCRVPEVGEIRSRNVEAVQASLTQEVGNGGGVFLERDDIGADAQS